MNEQPNDPWGDNAVAVVACPKCKHVNAETDDYCGECGAHLYVACRRCGHLNERVRLRCIQCGHRLHKTVWHRWRRRLYVRGKRIGALEIILFLLVLVLVYYYISRLGHPSPEPRPAEL